MKPPIPSGRLRIFPYDYPFPPVGVFLRESGLLIFSRSVKHNLRLWTRSGLSPVRLLVTRVNFLEIKSGGLTRASLSGKIRRINKN
jgi:hypothetical protein